MKKLFVIAILFGAALIAQPLSLKSKNWTATGWTVRASDLALVGYPNLKDSNVGSALAVSFPVFSGGSTFNTLNYLYTDIQTAPQRSLTITMAVTTTGSPVFNWKTEPGNNCTSGCMPASARPMIWTGFGGTCADGQSYVWCNRWWPKDYSYVLGPGTVTFTVPIDPATWTGVHGQAGTDEPLAWQCVQSCPDRIGITFGGGYFYGHGVYVTGGAAQFQISGYSIQ